MEGWPWGGSRRAEGARTLRVHDERISEATSFFVRAPLCGHAVGIRADANEPGGGGAGWAVAGRDCAGDRLSGVPRGPAGAGGGDRDAGGTGGDSCGGTRSDPAPAPYRLGGACRLPATAGDPAR